MNGLIAHAVIMDENRKLLILKRTMIKGGGKRIFWVDSGISREGALNRRKCLEMQPSGKQWRKSA